MYTPARDTLGAIVVGNFEGGIRLEGVHDQLTGCTGLKIVDQLSGGSRTVKELSEIPIQLFQ